ncbi:MAG: protease inhibitor I42 family protein [Gammaproteobacteria bacterium]
MKMIIQIFLCLILFVNMSFANTNLPSYNDSKQVINISENQDTFTIVLDSNPTTGYSWNVSSYNKNYIELLEHHYVATKPKLIGSGGKEYWTFKALPKAFKKNRTLKLALLYARPWDLNDQSRKIIFNLNIIKSSQ